MGRRLALFVRRPTIALALWVLAAVTSSAAFAADDLVRFSVHVGVNAPPPQSGLTQLSYADDDAWRMAEFFKATTKNTLWLTVLDDDTRRREAAAHLQPAPPTKAHLRDALARLREDVQREVAAGHQVELVFTYAGHGVVHDGKVKLALLDAAIGERFFSHLASWPELTRLHLIIDACHAGGLFVGRGFRSVSDATVTEMAPAQVASLDDRWFMRRPHVGALLSASGNEVTHEWSAIEGGLFTHEVLSALRGAADVDDDPGVTYDEVAAFSALAKSTLVDRSHASHVYARPPAAAPFAPLSAPASAASRSSPTGTLRIPASTRLRVQHRDGRPIAHIFTAAEASTLTLPADVPLVAERGDQARAAFTVSSTALVDASALPWAKSSSTRSGGGAHEGWLARPFTQDFVEGWRQQRRRVQKMAAATPTPRQPPASAPTKPTSASPAPTAVVDDAGGDRWLWTTGLAGVSALCAAGAVLSVVGMATSAAAYNSTDLEKPAADAEVDYTVATFGAVAFSSLAFAAGVSAGVAFVLLE